MQNTAAILELSGLFFYSGRKWSCIVHLFFHMIKKTCTRLNMWAENNYFMKLLCVFFILFEPCAPWALYEMLMYTNCPRIIKKIFIFVYQWDKTAYD